MRYGGRLGQRVPGVQPRKVGGLNKVDGPRQSSEEETTSEVDTRSRKGLVPGRHTPSWGRGWVRVPFREEEVVHFRFVRALLPLHTKRRREWEEHGPRVVVPSRVRDVDVSTPRTPGDR